MIYLELAIVAGEIAGLVFSVEKHGWLGQFVYYTQCSNYFLLVAVVNVQVPPQSRYWKRKAEGQPVKKESEKHLNSVRFQRIEAFFFIPDWYVPYGATGEARDCLLAGYDAASATNRADVS